MKIAHISLLIGFSMAMFLAGYYANVSGGVSWGLLITVATIFVIMAIYSLIEE